MLVCTKLFSWQVLQCTEQQQKKKTRLQKNRKRENYNGNFYHINIKIECEKEEEEEKKEATNQPKINWWMWKMTYYYSIVCEFWLDCIQLCENSRIVQSARILE